jgi:hypothetical protein
MAAYQEAANHLASGVIGCMQMNSGAALEV